MSQYNDEYGLRGVNLFGGSPVVVNTTDTELNPTDKEPDDTTLGSLERYFKCTFNIPSYVKELEYSNNLNIPVYNNEDMYVSTLEVPLMEKVRTYQNKTDIPSYDVEHLFNSSFMIPEILLNNTLYYNNKFKVPEYYREQRFKNNISIPNFNDDAYYNSKLIIPEYYKEKNFKNTIEVPKFNDDAYYNSKLIIPEYYREQRFKNTIEVPKFNNEQVYINTVNIPVQLLSIDYKSKLNIPQYDTSLFFKNNINIIEKEDDDGTRLKMFNSIIRIKKDRELFYGCTFTINPTNRMTMKADIIGYDMKEYMNTVKIMVPRIELFKSMVTIKPEGSMSLKFSVVGGSERLYRNNVVIWDDNQMFFKCMVIIPTVPEKPIKYFKNTIKISHPNVERYYKSTVRIEPNTKVNLTYDLLSGMDNLFRTTLKVSKEHTHLYKCSFVINPTNRMAMKADILGFNERLFKSNVVVEAQKYKLYPCKVTIGLGGHMYGRLKVDDTPKHLYYGNLKKDAHVIETIPNVNYGGDPTLFFNDRSIVFLEWSFEENKDQFYKSNLEFGAAVRLYLKKALPQKANGRVFLVKEEWNEYGIKYNNRPLNVEHITDFEVPRNYVGILDVDLDDLMYHIDKKNVFKISLAIEIDSEINTLSNSRETNIDIPALYYKYYYVPPNNRQLLFGMKMKILKAYGKGNGKGTKFPVLGEEAQWSHPARLYPCTVFRQPETVLPLYKTFVNVPIVNVSKMYKSTVSIYNPKPGTFMAKTNIKIALFDDTKYYNNTLFMPDLVYKVFKSTIEIERKDRERMYPTHMKILRGYGKGYDPKKQYPYLGEEGKWSGEAPHWKNIFNIPKISTNKMYPCKVVIQKAVGKGNGRYTQYPALGEQKPWSKPAIIFPSHIRISMNEETFYYKSTFFHDRRYEYMYPSFVNVPKFDNIKLYKSTVYLPETYIKLYQTEINVPKFDEALFFKATFKGISVSQVYYKSIVNIEKDGVKVRIFIM